MNRSFVSMMIPLLASLAGCGSDAAPPAPAIGAQIDRMGRPAINTALTDPFWDTGLAGATLEAHEAKQDIYNQQAPAQWLGNQPNFAQKAALFDGLDTGAGGICGNQVAFAGPLGAAYTTLSTALTDDQLFVDSTTSACNTFLGVELKALGATIPADCGGRTLTYNTIDTVYNALAGTTSGALAGVVQNGVTADANSGISNTTFPFLAAPN